MGMNAGVMQCVFGKYMELFQQCFKWISQMILIEVGLIVYSYFCGNNESYTFTSMYINYKYYKYARYLKL